MNKITVVALVVIALLVGAFGGFYFERSRATMTLEATKMAMQKQIDEAKMTVSPTVVMTQGPVMMAKAGFLTDTKGLSLYTFDKDTTSDSTCYGGCAKAWPPYLVGGGAPTTLPNHLGTTKRTDGTMQYTWNNHPLYYFASDTKAGDTTGDGVGGVWHLAK